ncbi:MAG: hypothetical protein HQK49_18060 [Oligoflexia bacterium]|nr:hypothetical protein [Oligoflexia bacterium]
MIFKEVVNFFNPHLLNIPKYERHKAVSLTYLMLVALVCLVFFLISLLFFAPFAVLKFAYIQIAFLMFTCSLSLYLLHRGYYKMAPSFTVNLLTMAVIAGYFGKLNKDFAVFSFSHVYYMLIVLSFAWLFCSKKQLVFTGSIIAISIFCFYYLSLDLYNGPLAIQVSRLALISPVAAVVAITIMSYFGISITEKNYVEILNENRKNQKLNNDLNSLMKKRFVELEAINANFKKVNEEIKLTEKTLGYLIKETNEYSQKSENTINTILSNSREGQEIISNVVSSVKSIENANHNLNSIMEIISQIRSKTTIINDIVFETKILSFNASIEAARAGEYGTGFSVVAQEVGHLAKISGDASCEITSLLENSNVKVNDIINDIKEQSKKTKEISSTSLDKFNEISRDIAVLCTEVQNIKHKALEQENKIKNHLEAMKIS